MTGHRLIQVHNFENIPKNHDLSLMDVKWMNEYEKALTASVDEDKESAYSVGYHSRACVRSIGRTYIELSWYPNTIDRFHEVQIILLRSAFIKCVACPAYDYDPVIFVDGTWLADQYSRSHSVFALVDAIGVKKAIQDSLIDNDKILKLRDQIDEIAINNKEIAFISFADSLLLKSNYFIGKFDALNKYNYRPENILKLMPAIKNSFEKILGLDIYVVLAQGRNEFSNDDLLHISSSKNHISLNSLGLPFAQIQAIDNAARNFIRNFVHPPNDVYMDETFYYSLNLKFTFDKNSLPRFPYKAPLSSGTNFYIPSSLNSILNHLSE